MIDLGLCARTPTGSAPRASVPAVRTTGSSTRCSTPTSAAAPPRRVRDAARRAEVARQAGRAGRRARRSRRCWRRPRSWPPQVKAAEADGRGRGGAARRARRGASATSSSDGVPGRRRGRLRRAARGRRAAPEFDFEPARPPRARRAARRDRHGARREGLRRRGSTSSRASAPGSSSALLNLAMAQAVEHGFTPMITPDAGEARGHGAAPASSAPTPTRSTASRPTTSTSSARPRWRWPATTPTRSSTCPTAPMRYAGLVVLLPPRGRVVRQGHPRHHPRAPVRQGRDVRLLPPRGAPRPSTSGCSAWRRRCSPRSRCPTGSSTPRRATSAARRRASTTARRGCRRRARYRELTSTSNCTTFQARRLNIRYRDDDGRHPDAARPSTARWRRPAGSSRSWRTTSRPTARCGCREALRPYLGLEVLEPA